MLRPACLVWKDRYVLVGGQVSWDVLSTSIVGLAGIGATLLAGVITSRAQSRNLQATFTVEQDRARLAEKRQVYGSYFGMLGRLVVVCVPSVKDPAAGLRK